MTKKKKTAAPKKASAPKTLACTGCGVVLDIAALKKRATQDILPCNKPVKTAGDQQFSTDCPICGAKRIYCAVTKGE